MAKKIEPNEAEARAHAIMAQQKAFEKDFPAGTNLGTVTMSPGELRSLIEDTLDPDGEDVII